jgi:uncharacterized protein (DUF3820 family)
MGEHELPGGEALLELRAMMMPFGKYQGRAVLDLPESYLLWFRQEGFPNGKLSQMMALALEIKINGLDSLVEEALGHGHGRGQL